MAATTTSQHADAILRDEALVEENLLEELENEDIPAEIREARLADFKRQTEQYHGLKERQHGEYTEITEEKQFLDLTTGEDRCIVHFFHEDFRRCAIMDGHLKSLSDKYFETKFAKINVEKAKFFVQKLKIKVLPAVICFKKGIVVDRIIGFDELGNTDTFPISNLEKRLNKCGAIDGVEIDEDDPKKKSIFGFRGTQQEDDSDSD